MRFSNSEVIARRTSHLASLAPTCPQSPVSLRLPSRHDVLRSNLLRDTIDGEPAVVQACNLWPTVPAARSVLQVTTPAAEFQCDMEFWDIPERSLELAVRRVDDALRPGRHWPCLPLCHQDDTAQQPQRRRLRHTTLGCRGAWKPWMCLELEARQPACRSCWALRFWCTCVTKAVVARRSPWS